MPNKHSLWTLIIAAALPATLSSRDASLFLSRVAPAIFENKQGESVPPRRLDEGGDEDNRHEYCDTTLTDCILHDSCLNCFTLLKDRSIDWVTLSSQLECTSVMGMLWETNMCYELQSDAEGKAAFCRTYRACVQKPREENYHNITDLDCSKLKTCDFPGFHEQFLGDGICQDRNFGCYNSEACGWDGGDCCIDTCESPEGRIECGTEPYMCRNPRSEHCDQRLVKGSCIRTNEDGEEELVDDAFFGSDDEVEIACAEDQMAYRLVMYDSFGDGWEETELIIREDKSNGMTIFRGGLEMGSTGTEYLCFDSGPACYSVEAKGGTWGKEVSWEVKPMREGSSAVASGGAPMRCGFPLFGETTCENTCTGRTDEDPTNDPDYRDFKNMFKCVNDKCPIQLAACDADPLCQECVEEEDMAPEYCFDLEDYNNVVSCALCQCSEVDTRSDFCTDSQSNTWANPEKVPSKDAEERVAPCTPMQTVEGGGAILEFNLCTDFDKLGMLLVQFDQNEFGDIDTFEACAHAYKDETNHGGHTALGCMRILKNAVDGVSEEEIKNPRLAEAISHLANFLYFDANNYCDCVNVANNDAPMCPAFVNFKTLMYESLDACSALDEIDCDAWNEFYFPCNEAMEQNYGRIDFTRPEQCDFVQQGCGNAGPFPVFRKLDCESTGEVTTEAWNFYLEYSDKCLEEGGGGGSSSGGSTPSGSQPVPVPSPASYKATSAPTLPTDGTAPKKKSYIPPEKRNKDSSKKDESTVPASGDSKPKKKRKSHFFRNVFLLALFGGGGYYAFTKYRNEGFNFGRFRRNRQLGGDVYSGLAMESSTSFEPPSLPPPPSMMSGGGQQYI